MYRQSRGRRKIFHHIYTLVNQVQQRCIWAATSDIPLSINLDNLLSIQHVQLPKLKVTFYHCALINCQSVNKKSADLALEIYSNNLDLHSPTEMWIKPDDSTTPIVLCPPGYKIISVPWDDSVGEAVALVHREEIPVTHNATYNYESMECSDFKVSLSSFNLNQAVIYQPPNKSVLAFKKDFLDYMEKNINASGKTLLIGDFNIKVNDPNCSDNELFTELLDSFGLVNHTQFTTHEHENTLDLMITSERETFAKDPSQDRIFSDHNVVVYDMVSTKIPKPPKETRYRKYKAIDTDSFGWELAEAIGSLNLDSMSPN